jgi:serine/threonine-protein phosphatase 5
LHKYDKTCMELFTCIFNNLPLCAVLERSVFVTHGGLSTLKDGANTLDEIRNITRNREPPESGLMSDLMWSGR